MGWLPMYLFDSDVDCLVSWLNSEDQIAYIVTNGERRWRATSTVDRLAEGHHVLWHIPSGPLPLVASITGGRNKMIADPWGGWCELRTGADPTIPWFGSGQTGVIRLELWPNGLPWQREKSKMPMIGLSDFQWVGNHYGIIGRRAHPETERWWRRLQRWVKKTGTRITREGPINIGRTEIYAFPAALKAISQGIDRSTL